MTQADRDESATAPAGRLADTPAAAVRPHLSVIDLALQLWRAKGLMIAVGLPVLALGLAAAISLPTDYTATSRLFARLDDFYVYRPLAGEAAAGVTLEQDQVVQAELELLRSPAVAERVLERIDWREVYPELARTPEAGAPREAVAVDALMKDFEASAEPDKPVILTAFTHGDPETAAIVLNAYVEAYLDYRSTLLADTSSVSFARQRNEFERDLASAEAAMQAFLQANEISDFDGEQAAVQSLFAGVQTDLVDVDARYRAAMAELETLRGALSRTRPEVDLYVEDTTDQTLLDLKLQREDLLSRYTPDSRTVQAIDRRIAQAEAYLAAQPGAAGTVRRGPNPVFQELEARVAQLSATAQSLAEQRAELRRQLAGIQTRQQRLSELLPRWRELSRTRDLIEDNVRAYASRELDARTRSALARSEADAVRVLEPARAPLEGSNLKMPVAVLALLLAGFSALMAGLLRAVTRKSFATGASLERTLGVPVLARVAKRQSPFI